MYCYKQNDVLCVYVSINFLNIKIMVQKRLFSRFKKITVFLLGGVANQVFAQNPSLYDIIATSPSHNTLEAAIDAAGLKSTLQGTGSMTVFAPTDDAFSKLPTGTVESLLQTPEGLLKEILLYHVLGAEVNSGAVQNGAVVAALSTLNTLKLTKTTSGKVFINHAEVTTADLPASNGILHVIDEVLLPNKTVVDIALGSTVHTTLVQAVIKAELLPALTDPAAKYTVFAPTNDAFAMLLPQGLGSVAAADLAPILLYHVLGDSVASAKVSNGLVAQPLNSANSIKLSRLSSKVFANQAEVIVADLRASNGIVHAIDKVLLPIKTVVDIALGSAAHSTLVQAVIKAGLLPALTDPMAKYTVFAPTNDAFSKIPSNTLQDLLQDSTGALKNVLLYHVVADSVRSTALSNNQVIKTLLGNESITITINNGVFVNTNSQVTLADLKSENGIVHVVNEVLLPYLTSVNDNEQLSGLDIYPNPASSMLNISLPTASSFKYSVVNAHGQMILSGDIAGNNAQIPMVDLNTGIYKVLVQTAQGQKAFTVTKE